MLESCHLSRKFFGPIGSAVLTFIGYRQTIIFIPSYIYIYIYVEKKLLPLNKKNKNESSKDLKQNLNCSIIFRWFWLYCNWTYEGHQDFRGGGGSTSSPAGTGVHKDRRGNIYFVFLKFKNRNICNNHFYMRVCN